MAYFVSATDPYQRLLSVCCPPPVFRRGMEFPSPALLFCSDGSSLQNNIVHPVWLKWALFGGGDQPLLPSPAHLLAGWEPTRVSGLHRRDLFLSSFQQGPSVSWGLHLWGKNAVHSPFEAFFIHIQFPLLRQAAQQSIPSWSCMPIICRLKLLQCASPQQAQPYLEWASGTIVLIIWGSRDFNKRL